MSTLDDLMNSITSSPVGIAGPRSFYMARVSEDLAEHAVTELADLRAQNEQLREYKAGYEQIKTLIDAAGGDPGAGFDWKVLEKIYDLERKHDILSLQVKEMGRALEIADGKIIRLSALVRRAVQLLEHFAGLLPGYGPGRCQLCDEGTALINEVNAILKVWGKPA